MYLPNIESKAEDWFYHEFKKRSNAEITPQKIVRGDFKKYRHDFIIRSANNDFIAIEVDGKNYHNEKKDYARDCDILKNNSWLSAIIRFDAHDMVYNSPLATIFICNFFPVFVFGAGKEKESLKVKLSIIERYKSGLNIKTHSRIHKSIKDAEKYLEFSLNVFNVSDAGYTYNKNDYLRQKYAMYFMPNENINVFTDAINDQQGDAEYQEEFNPLDFCVRKTSTVRFLNNKRCGHA